MMYLRLELKVCEGCGALWLRDQQKLNVYCTSCTALLSDYPQRRKHAGGRPRGVRGGAHGKVTSIGTATSKGGAR